MQDKYTAVWVSHSSISDFLKCPRAYYLSNIYKDPHSGHKISITNPYLALGQTVHTVLESLSTLPVDKRFEIPLMEKYEENWQKVTGRLGGFKDDVEENEFKSRGALMIQKVITNPGPISRKTIKLKNDLPYYYLSDEENIILCGKIDWLEYNESDDSVGIIDFKTGKNEEDQDSLQLAIYHLLVKNCQNREVSKASYWYLGKDDGLVDFELPPLDKAKDSILDIALKIKAARQTGEFKCEKDGCYACQDLEKVVKGEAEFVGTGTYNKDVYIVDRN